MVDVPMLRKIVEWVEEQDKLPKLKRQWDQRDWFDNWQVEDAKENTGWYQFTEIGPATLDCDTKACACGYLAVLNEATLSLHQNEVRFDGVSPMVYGAETLGIDYDEALDLFNGNNSAARVRAVAEQIAGEPL